MLVNDYLVAVIWFSARSDEPNTEDALSYKYKYSDGQVTFYSEPFGKFASHILSHWQSLS